jgi:hemerythrin-like domain-containing protein
MTDKLSVIRSDEINLETTQADRAASFIKAVAGAAPVVGSLVAELITATIPNQKQDRIVAFLKALGDKVKYIEEDVLQAKMKADGFSGLIEEAMAKRLDLHPASGANIWHHYLRIA